MKKGFLTFLALYLGFSCAFAAEPKSLGNQYDRSVDWYGLQIALDGSGYRVSIYMNGLLIEPVFMDNDKKSEGVFQLQNTDAPNGKIAPAEYKSLFSLNRGPNLLTIEYALVSESVESSFLVKINAGKMFDNSNWSLANIVNPPGKNDGIIEFEFHLPGDLTEDRIISQ